MYFSRILFAFILVFFIISCGNKKLENNDYVFMANVFLSDRKCNLALDELSKVDTKYHDFYYYQALSSAKACKANYNVLDFINEIDNFGTTDAFFNFLAGLNTSNETLPTSNNFIHLADGINSILFLDAVTRPKFSDRLTVIKNRSHNEELGLQALLMIFTYLGKWLALYGDTNDDGLKGTGVLCLTAYSTEASSFLSAAERLALLGADATCKFDSVASSPLLVLGSNEIKDRLCNFIVYFNHVRDLITNITLSSNSSMGDLSDAFDDMEDYVEAAEVAFPGISGVLDFYNLNSCTTYYDLNNNAKKNIHAFMAGIVDKNFQ